MFKLLLCIRYLKTRYIALASIISVMLGVATMIVVNSVMAGFQNEMHKRLHSILSDVVIDSHSMDGITNPEEITAEVRNTLGDDLAGLTTTVHFPAILSFRPAGHNEYITKQITLIGVDPESYAQVGDFSKYLLHPSHQQAPDFDLQDGGYDSRIADAGTSYRRWRKSYDRALDEQRKRMERSLQPEDTVPLEGEIDAPPVEESDAEASSVDCPHCGKQVELADEHDHESDEFFDPTAPVDDVLGIEEDADPDRPFDGIIMGIALANIRQRDAAGDVQDFFLCQPGDDVTVTLYTAGTPPKAAIQEFTVVDFYESKMSEYDSNFAFVPLSAIQELRGMFDPMSGVGAVTSIQLRLQDGVDLDEACAKLQDRFPVESFHFQIRTWKELQGPLLAAVQLETTLLNILLFLIIAVAGFGILATFFMTVIEKTRDIGILKSLGAPSRSVMSIFLSYGLSLGVVGSGVGVILGLLFVFNINSLADLIQTITGKEVFDPTVYYFQEIPTIVSPLTVLWIMIGAMSIAVVASILPALRAAKMHPVEALRYE